MLGAKLNPELEVPPLNPNPVTAALEANLDSNTLLDVRRHSIGLGAEDTTVEFAAPEVAGTGAIKFKLLTVKPCIRSNPGEDQESTPWSLREVSPRLIKMDVEGYGQRHPRHGQSSARPPAHHPT